MRTSFEGLQLPHMTVHLEEPRWLAAAQHGEPRALEWMFQTYHRSVYSLCYRLLSRTDDAEDAAQATFVGAFRGIEKFHGKSSFKTWLYRIAVNESLNLLRQRRCHPDRLDDAWPAEDSARDIVQKVAVSAALGRIRPESRLALVLYYWEDLTCEEVATILGISLSAAKMRLKRAREEFQRRYGGEP